MGVQWNRPVEGTSEPVAPLGAYIAAVAVTVAAILSQYVVPQAVPALRPVYGTLVTSLLVVYGVPIVAFAVLVGRRPLNRYFARTGSAVVQGLRWYGVMSSLGLVAAFAIILALSVFDPSALPQLLKPNPTLTQAASNPWFWVAFSFVIGMVEETIFRGWIFGYWLLRSPSRWVAHALWTSALFAAAHLYYGTTYGFTSTVAFSELFFSGLALSFAMRYSGGNLLIVGLLHGLHDALIFATLVSHAAGTDLFYLLILVGDAVALALFLRSRPRLPPIAPWIAGPGLPLPGVAENPAIRWPPPGSDGAERPPLPFPSVPPPPPAPTPAEGPPPAQQRFREPVDITGDGALRRRDA
jgi:membrane protease YdiL (CAAX protease family)